jgi:hypothetical protein
MDRDFDFDGLMWWGPALVTVEECIALQKAWREIRTEEGDKLREAREESA